MSEKTAHYLKRKSSFIVVVLRSLRHKACVGCGKPIASFEESVKHWEKALKDEQPKKELLKYAKQEAVDYCE